MRIKRSVALNGECRVKLLVNKMTRILVSNKKDVTREWRKLHNEELHNLFSSSNIVEVLRPKRTR
jgi:hypothetical protein